MQKRKEIRKKYNLYKGDDNKTRCCTLRRAKNTPTRSSRCAVNLERGDTVQFTIQKPYIKYKIISSSRS